MVAAPKHITFLYGTETGVSEEYCYLIASIVAKHGVAVTILPADELSVAKWGRHVTQAEAEGGFGEKLSSTASPSAVVDSPVILVVSTAGQGDMPMTLKNTWDVLRTSQAPYLGAYEPEEGEEVDPQDPPRSTPCRFAVFGLGDSTYSKYNYAAKMLHNRLVQLGGEPIVHRGLGDERDGKGIWQELEPWLTGLWAALGLTHLAEVSAAAAAANAKKKEDVAESDNVQSPFAVEAAALLAMEGMNRYRTVTANHRRSESDASDNATNPCKATDAVASPGAFGSRPGCWDFTVKNNTRLTAPDHFQHVSFVEFQRDVSDPEKSDYQPGDCLALYPLNSEDQVNRVLKCLSIKPNAATTINDTASSSSLLTPDTLITVHPNNNTMGFIQQPSRPFYGKPISVRELLTRFIDLEGTVSQTFLRMFSLCTRRSTPDDVDLIERMRDLGAPRNCEDYNRFAYREKRTVSEVMEDFPKVRVSLDDLISNAPLMRPRYYSISSSPSMDRDHIGLTVARFDLKTPLGRERKGLCSRRLCGAKAGDTIEGQFLHRPFNIDPEAPLILIGPGTGVAPLRGLIRERMASSPATSSSPADMILFFGCRNKAGDYLHGEEWGAFAPHLHVVTAFSRDDASGKKEYVQHKLIDDSAAATRVYKLLTLDTTPLEAGQQPRYGGGAVVIICGNAKHMPASVQDALANILVAGGGRDGGIKTKDDALAEINRMRVKGKIKFETWSV